MDKKKENQDNKEGSNNENYIFVSDNILQNINNMKDNPSVKITNNKRQRINLIRELKKIHSRKVDNKLSKMY